MQINGPSTPVAPSPRQVRTLSGVDAEVIEKEGRQKAVRATLPGGLLPAALVLQEDPAIQGYRAFLQQHPDMTFPVRCGPEGRIIVDIDPAGPEVIFDPATLAYAVAARETQASVGAVSRRLQEWVQPQGGRTYILGEKAIYGVNHEVRARSFMRVDEAPSGELSALRVDLAPGAPEPVETALEARRTEGGDITLREAGLGAHVKKEGVLGGLGKWWKRQEAEALSFTPFHASAGTLFPALAAALSGASPPPPPQVAEPSLAAEEPGPPRPTVEQSGEEVRIGSVNLPVRRRQED
jgi:hypothetical protein